MIKNQIILGIASVLLSFTISCTKEKKAATKDQGYIIEGTIKNMPDSTWIYFGTNKEKDSTIILGEKFTFSGIVEEPESRYISFKDYKEGFIPLWIENQKIDINAERGSFREAKINAGKAQEEAEISHAREKLLRTEYDTIVRWYETGRVTKNNNDSIRNRSKRIFEELDSISIAFVKEFPDSYVSATTLTYLKSKLPKSEVDSLYGGLSERIKNSKNGLTVKHFLSLPETPEIGETFIDFALPTSEGNSVKLSDHIGKYTLVEFWAAWCGPCRMENPELVKTYKQYKDQGFTIFGVSLDERKKDWIKAVQKDSLPWIQVSDLKGFETEPAMIYGINGIPNNFLIDEQGIVISKNLRGTKLKEKLETLFGQ